MDCTVKESSFFRVKMIVAAELVINLTALSAYYCAGQHTAPVSRVRGVRPGGRGCLSRDFGTTAATADQTVRPQITGPCDCVPRGSSLRKSAAERPCCRCSRLAHCISG